MKTLMRCGALCLFCVFLVLSCSDPVGDGGDADADRPAIPEPAAYSGMVPAMSAKLIVQTVPLSDYSPVVIGATPRYGCDVNVRRSDIDLRYYNHYAADTLYTAWAPGDTIGIKAERKELLVDGEPVIGQMFLCYCQSSPPQPGPYWYAWSSKPLTSQPYLQLVRYWVRVGDVERYSGNTSKTTTRSTTRGTTETSASEFSRTLGIETTISGSWYVDLELKVKAEFSWKESHETSIMHEETFGESFTIACPENKNLVYCVWQLIEEYRIVDENGDFFTDPDFLFDDAYHSTICPTRELVPMTTYFGN